MPSPSADPLSIGQLQAARDVCRCRQPLPRWMHFGVLGCRHAGATGRGGDSSVSEASSSPSSGGTDVLSIVNMYPVIIGMGRGLPFSLPGLNGNPRELISSGYTSEARDGTGPTSPCLAAVAAEAPCAAFLFGFGCVALCPTQGGMRPRTQ